MTKYEQCQKSGHKRSRHSPNGITIIEECESCRLQWVMPTIFALPGEKPITIHNPLIIGKTTN